MEKYFPLETYTFSISDHALLNDHKVFHQNDRFHSPYSKIYFREVIVIIMF